MANPISAFSAGLIQQSIGASNSRFASTIAHIASGRRIAQASEDIAALSAATSLQTEVSGLRSAALNITQASSMLQVADGGMGQIGSILDRMGQLAVQANSGALSQSARQGINTEFQNLSQEIDRLAGNTNFNNVSLLNGAQSAGNGLATVAAKGNQATGAVQLTANVGAGQTINLNGVTLTEGVDFKAGATAQQTTANLSNSLNSDKRFDGFTFSSTNSTLNIKADAAGSAGNQFTISQTGSTAAFNVVGDSLSGAGTFSLQGGTDAGVSSGDVKATGVVGDNIVTAQSSQVAASTTARFNSSADIVAGNTIQIDNGEGGQTTFTFVNGAPANANQIQIGANVQGTLQNAANAINNFSGAGDFGVRQLNATVDGTNLVISNKTAGNAVGVNGNAIGVALNTSGGALSNAQLNNGSTGGIDTSGLAVADVSGGIKGFNATFSGPNNVALSVNVGGETFRANVTNTTPGANSTVRFTSQTGGFFDVTLAGGNGSAVTNQTDANRFASRLDTAFSGIQLNQTRDVANFAPNGALAGSKLEISSAGFRSPLNVQDISVLGNGNTSQINISVNGQVFRSGTLGTSLVAGQQVNLKADNGDVITFTNGNQAQTIGTTTGANNFKAALQSSIGFGSGTGTGAPFQIGANSDDKLNLTIGNLTTKALFGGQTFNLLSADGAAAASVGVGRAIDTLTTQRADVGAFQQALNFTAANLDSAIQNQEAARSVLTDTDFGSESTLNSLLQTQNQAGIAALAQTNRLSGNLLQLLVK